ncbi:hypothetical protein BAE44_0023620 [Dichanthelium oligosanthes]|uniref:Uncharacterized protein n=1 Tax=Dichanthelium oligosanthes TaxID=888268 RepID=A0A1E5UR56_9POAL|nr:hypothetical protein BAE44_0023620 [Dichanthelium oligosanthes]
MLRLSESTNIVGIMIKCLQLLVTPHFRSTVEAMTRQLANLLSQDFSWVSHHQHEPCEPCEGNTAGTMRLSEVPLESVIEVYWQCQIPLSEYNTQRRAIAEGPTTSSKDTPHLKLGLLFTPHGSLGEVTPKAGSSTLEVIDGKEQHGTQTNLSLQQLDETMLPKAMECLYLKSEATAYQMLWQSKHGAVYLQVKKTMPGRNTGRDNRKRSLTQRYHC